MTVMKKFFLAILISVITVVGVSAHNPDRPACPYKYSVRLFGALSPENQLSQYESDNPLYIYPSNFYSTRKGPMEYIYSDWSGEIRNTSLLFGGDFAWTPYKWLTIKGTLGLACFSHANYSPFSEGVAARGRGAVLTALPEIQINYVNTRWVRMYLGGGLGLGAYMGYGGEAVRIEGQFDIVGIEIGKKVFGFYELGIGTLYMGAKFGLGYRF